MSTPKITPTRTHRLAADGVLQPLLRPFQRLGAWLGRCFTAGGQQPPAIRAGMLDTGELVLVDAYGRAQTFSAGTTRLIRNTVGAVRIDPLAEGGAAITWPPVPQVPKGTADPAPGYSWS